MIVFCLANVRSGTTAIARCFRDDPKFVNLGEVFYNSEDGKGHYVLEWEKGEFPSISVFDEYLNFLRNEKRYIYWVDVKFHDLNRFNPLQFGKCETPLMIQRIMRAGDPIVLISRDNHLRGACSEMQAIETGNFHMIAHDQEGDPGESAIDRAHTIETVKLALERSKSFQDVERLLVRHRNLFRLDYEAIFESEARSETRAALRQWMGLDKSCETDLRKIATGWPSWFDQDLARELLKNTSTHWWLS